MLLDECKQMIKAYIGEQVMKGTRKANIEIELIHYIKSVLYKED